MKKIYLLFSLLLIVLIATGCVSKDYEEAQSELEGGNYNAAIDILESLGNYKNSNELLSEAKRLKAQQLSDDGQYSEALVLLEGIDNYDDASELIESIKAELQTTIINTSADAFTHIEGSMYGGAMALQNILVSGYITSGYAGYISAQQEIKHAIDSLNDVVNYCGQYGDMAEIKSACEELVALYEPIGDLDVSISTSSLEEFSNCINACYSSSIQVIANELVPQLLLLKDGGTGELSISYDAKVGQIPYLDSVIELLQR